VLPQRQNAVVEGTQEITQQLQDIIIQQHMPLFPRTHSTPLRQHLKDENKYATVVDYNMHYKE